MLAEGRHRLHAKIEHLGLCNGPGNERQYAYEFFELNERRFSRQWHEEVVAAPTEQF